MKENRISVAIVGAGIGREHLSAYLELPAHYQVSVLCDLDHHRAKEVVAGRSIAIETDLHGVLKDNTIDLIDICLPPHLHFDAIKSALAASKHVICEKPLVTSLREVDQIIEIADATGRQVFPVFQYRYGKAMTQLKSLMHAGLAGKPYVASLETHWNRGADYYAIPWRGTWQGEQGGAVLGHAIHSHDLLATVFGPVEKVYASTATRVNEIETEDCAAIVLQMNNGAVATSSITLGAATDTSRLRFCFEGLTAQSGDSPYSPMCGDWKFIAREPARQNDIIEVLSQVGEVNQGFTGYLESVANCLADKSYANGQSSIAPGSSIAQGSSNVETHVTLQQARNSIELISAIYQSVETGGAITLPLDQKDTYYHSWMPAR